MLKVEQVTLVHREPKETREPTATKELRVLKVELEQQVHREPKEIRELTVIKELRE